VTAYRFATFALAVLALSACARRPGPPIAPVRAPIAVIPAPLSMQEGVGAFALDSAVEITVDAPSEAALQVGWALQRQLRPATGFPMLVSRSTEPTRPRAIRLNERADRADLGDEGYALVVTPDSVVLDARTPAGLYHGIQTIRQLLPWGIEGENAVVKYGDWKIPVVRITDRPRFAWRGAMLDVSRHFFTVDEVKQWVDILALYKFNILHLHLGDDQGFRIEIKSRPELTRVPAATQVGGGPGGFYTQAEYEEIVRYAAERFITTVPEIDMPAHSNALLIPYPQLSCGRIPPAPYFSIRVGFSALCPDSAGTWELVDDVIREVSALTPARIFTSAATKSKC
jgi:hexosaminidase